MNWAEAIANLDKSDGNTDYCSHYNLQSALGLTGDWIDYTTFDIRLKKYWVHRWLCTDTHVGLAVYCLDGEAVAVSSQSARKNEEKIEFVSLEAAQRLREFILSLTPEDDALKIADLQQKIDPRWFSGYYG